MRASYSVRLVNSLKTFKRTSCHQSEIRQTSYNQKEVKTIRIMATAKVYEAVPKEDIEAPLPADVKRATAEQVVEAKVVATEEECCRGNRGTKFLIALGVLGLLAFTHQHFCRRSGAWDSNQRVCAKTNAPRNEVAFFCLSIFT